MQKLIEYLLKCRAAVAQGVNGNRDMWTDFDFQLDCSLVGYLTAVAVMKLFNWYKQLKQPPEDK